MNVIIHDQDERYYQWQDERVLSMIRLNIIINDQA